jgi:peptidoglycan/xylan/chitin deacetylase (PgdA/CDA1 family)
MIGDSRSKPRFVRRAAAAALRRARRVLPSAPRPVILMYHRIADDSFDPWGLAVTPENFAEQLDWLAANRTVLPLNEFAERHRQQSLPRNAAAITFDDGYESTAKVATPLLAEYGLPATVFLPVELIENGEPFWWDELQRITFGFTGNSLSLDGTEMHLGEQSPADSQWPPAAMPRTPRQSAFHRMWATLRGKAPRELRTSMELLRSQADDARWNKLEGPMSGEQARQIRSATLRFGSHALTHPSLPRLGTAEKKREIGESIERCATLTGAPPSTFAYPYGDRDGESESLVQQAGFLCACATDGHSVTGSSGLFALPRIGVGNWSGRQFARQLATA